MFNQKEAKCFPFECVFGGTCQHVQNGMVYERLFLSNLSLIRLGCWRMSNAQERVAGIVWCSNFDLIFEIN